MVNAAAIYCRISRDRSQHALGVKRQEADCRKVARQKGWAVATTYIDDDVSAYVPGKRPEYKRMLEDLEAGVIDAVVVYDLDRLHRHPWELEEFFRLHQRVGFELASVAGEHDLGTSDGQLFARIMGAVAKKESDDKRRRIQRKHQELAEAGLPKGGPRGYGYEADGLRVKPSEARVIRDASKRVIAGQSLYSIVQRLNEKEVPTVRGSVWTAQTLKTVLTSHRIIGVRVHHGREIGPAKWDPILDRVTWERVGRVLNANKGKRQAPRRYLLTGGIAVCGRCGAWLHAQRRHNGKPGYNCLTVKDGCGRLTVDADNLDRTVTEMVLMRTDKTRLRLREDDRELAEDLQAIQHDEAKLLELIDLWTEDKLDQRAYLRGQRTLQERIAATRERIARRQTGSSLAPYNTPGALRVAWPDLASETKRAIIATILTVKVMPSTQRGPIFDVTRVVPTFKV